MRQFLIRAAVIAFMVLQWKSFTSFGADNPAVGSSPPSLQTVNWAGQGTTFESLKGKTTVVVTYVTWCPICNNWAKEALIDVPKFISNKPIVVLAISTDTIAPKAKAFMEDREIKGPQILHGYDPMIATRFGFSNKFYNYVIIDPDLKVVAAGNVGYYYTVDDKKEHVLIHALKQIKEFGKFRYVEDTMSPALKDIAFPMEFGTLPSANDLVGVKKGLKSRDRTEFDELMNSFLNDQLTNATALAEGDPLDKLTSFETATYLSTSFKTTEPGKQAKKLLVDLNKDKELKKELAAKRLYDDVLKRPEAEIDKQERIESLQNIARKFAGTRYSKMAKELAQDLSNPKEQASGRGLMAAPTGFQ